MSYNNQVIIVGSLGADPGLRFAQSGTAVLSFRVATTERWKDKSGAQKEETEWHSVVVFGDRATEYAPNLAKGTYVRVEGKLKTEAYEKDGVKRYTTKIHAQSVAPGGFPRSDQASGAPAFASGNQIPFGAPAAQPDYGGIDVDNVY
jgi:single-strand DNA-binding protein